MRNYWLKIVLGALAVFALGMAGISVVRAIARKARGVAEGTDPISIPLAFIPFRLDGERLGTFDRIVLLRKAPHQVSGVDLRIRLTDTAAARRLEGCALFAELPHAPGGGHTVQDVEFRCIRGGSAAFPAESVGQVTLLPGGRRLTLLVPPDLAAELHHADAGARAERMADSISASAERTSDSLDEAMSRLSDSLARIADSVTALHEHRADSIRRAALRTADSVRRRLRAYRDTVRAELRGP
jgi:hypothetical protein